MMEHIAEGLRSQSSTTFVRDLIYSENGFFRKSFGCQTRRSGESMVQLGSAKKKMKKKTRGTLNTSFGKHDIFAAPHTGQPQIGTAANFCCISCQDGCRQDIPGTASATGKLHINANFTLARKEKTQTFPVADNQRMFPNTVATLISPKLDGQSTQFKR